MKKNFIIITMLMFCLITILTACQPGVSNPAATQGKLKVVAAESFLADIAQNIAGDRFTVDTLIPMGMDPHAFEPVPKDVAKITESDIVIINGGGIEGWMEDLIKNAGTAEKIVVASSGLQSREVHHGEDEEVKEEESGEEGHHHEDGDPHFWLDPVNVIQYVNNIRDGFIEADPEGKEVYIKNADVYTGKLQELDRNIRKQLESVPVEKRLIVTNHESFGYFADRYGFTVIGTIVPSVNTGSSPSAQQLARLIDDIKTTGASVIFLETGTNPQLAKQISNETGIKVVNDLFTHSITPPDGKAPTYIDMMKFNTSLIMDNLK